jgi:sulfofructose kinase
LFDAEGVVGAICDSPSADLIRSVHVLFVDHVGSDGMIRAAKIAKNAGVAIVGDFEGGEASRLSKLLELVDHLILPLEFASKLTDAPDPAGAVRSLWNDTRETVVVTMGDRGCLYMTGSQSDCVKHQLAFKVRAVDITGCGDVFHGAYASALARGLDIFERIRFASAASAIKAVNLGGQNGIPNCSAVEEFLKNH